MPKIVNMELHTSEDLDAKMRRVNSGRPYIVAELGDKEIWIEPDQVVHQDMKLPEADMARAIDWFTAYAKLRNRRPGLMWKRCPGTPISVGLIGCGKLKLPHAAPAKELYVGDLFRKARAWVEEHCDEWAILSAKHGLVMPDQVIEPYDKTVKDMDRDDREGLARRVNQQVYMQWGEETHYVLMCGELYRMAFESLNSRDLPYEVPMKSLGIGEQLGWLKNRLNGTPKVRLKGRA